MKIPASFTYGCMGLLLILAISCHNDSEDLPVNEYLEDYELVLVYPQPAIAGLLTAFSIEYPEMDDIVENATYGVEVYRISYKTHYRDSVITASGLVCIPSAGKSFPVISFQNGTNTSHDNAPSVNPTNASYLMMEYMASNGYIILMTDYIGFGSSSQILHPYYHQVSSNSAVIDMLHALDEFTAIPGIQAKNNDSIFLMGYSQGGWATLSALEEMEQGSESSLNVVATSCGAGAYDLMSMSAYVLSLETFPGPLYLPFFIYSQKVYGNIPQPLTSFFKEPYASDIPELFGGEYSNDEVNEGLTETMADFITGDMLAHFESGATFSDLRETLAENSLSGWNTLSLLNIYHGTGDMNVPPQQSEELYAAFISSGASADRVQYYELEDLTHGTALMPWGIKTMNWFNTLKN